MRPRTGWFSDCSVCYLAAGRPAVTQETGFSKTIRSGAGLFAFATIEEIGEAITRINGDYREQCRAALEIAHEFFDADKVLREVLRMAEI